VKGRFSLGGINAKCAEKGGVISSFRSCDEFNPTRRTNGGSPEFGAEFVDGLGALVDDVGGVGSPALGFDFAHHRPGGR
jgi:hypothetical protein